MLLVDEGIRQCLIRKDSTGCEREKSTGTAFVIVYINLTVAKDEVQWLTLIQLNPARDQSKA